MDVVGSIKKLNNQNYSTWATCLESYLQGQGLWSLIGGSETREPAGDNDAIEKWKMRAGKAMFAIKVTIEDEMLEHVRYTTTPKDAWDTLASRFSKKNDMKLQLLENELLSTVQGKMTVSQYFTKIKSICREITELDLKSKIEEDRMRRIIIHDLAPEYRSFIAAVQGWPTPPTLEQLENLLTNQETLTKKGNGESTANEEEALFSNRQKGQFTRKNFRPRQDKEQDSPRQPRYQNARRGRPRVWQGQEKKPNNNFKRENDGCYNCGKKGHYARDCWHKKRMEGNAAMSSNPEEHSEEEWNLEVSAASAEVIEECAEEASDCDLVLSTMTEEYQNILEIEEEDGVDQALATSHQKSVDYKKNWIFDSGCSNHMTGDKEKLKDTTKYEGRRVVVTANNAKLPISHVGRTMVTSSCNSKEFQLDEVYHVPGIKKNLLSITQLTAPGNYVVFGPDDVKVCKEIKIVGTPLMEGLKKDSMYVMSAESAYIDRARKNDTVDLWHARLGHVSYHKLQVMMKKSMLKGLSQLEVRDNIVCAGCQYGKAHQLPYEESHYKAKEPLQLVHSDVFGRVKQTSISGCRYMVTFIDDYSRYVWVAFMKEKSETFMKFKEFKEKVEAELGRRIKVLRTDNGGEYKSDEFYDYLKRHKIRRQLTCPRTPQQNGVAERKNRHLAEVVRSMLHAKNVPGRFWAECMKTAVYITNKLPQARFGFISPFEKIWKMKPTVSHLRVFGCVCYVLVPEQERSKFDKKAKRCIFLGYDSERKGWRCYDPTTNKAMVSRNVVFDEASSWWTPVEVLLPDKEKESQAQESEGEQSEVKESTHPDPMPESSQSKVMQSPNLKETGEFEEFLPSQEGMPKTNDDEQPELRRSKRPRRSNPKYANAAIIEEEKEPTSYEEASKHEKWRKAMKEEIRALIENETWEIVPKPMNAQPISCKWIYKVKTRPDGSVKRYKARLVARGFSQQYGLDYDETFSPVAKITTVRVLLALAATKGWKLWQMDVKNAFLHGELDREIYMDQPQGFESVTHPGYVCKLKKALYGLKQAPRAWYGKIAEYLDRNGYMLAPADSSLFVKNRQGKLSIVLVYVDDLIITGDDVAVISQIKENLSVRFRMKELGELRHFLGLEVERTKEGLFLCQHKYAKDLLEKYGMLECKPVTTPVEISAKLCSTEGKDLEDRTIYRQLVGSLIYLTLTRPDISYAVGLVSRFMESPKKPHLEAAKRILRYVKGTVNHGIFYKRGGTGELVGYCDADYAGDLDTRKSTTGYVFSIGSGPVSWCSKKQSTVALSTTEAEYKASAMAAQECVWLVQLLQNLGQQVNYSVPIYCDNQSAMRLVENSVFHARTKHVEVQYHFIREKVLQGFVSMKYVNTEDQVADIFTKGLSGPRLQDLTRRLGVTEKDQIYFKGEN
ncbi:unnamed protein product [Linum trigynum]|uniref:Polyprotein n=1 Tax=Linum trigynum TaxID=586398 RepID=A0AAV2F0G6_9ROSI